MHGLTATRGWSSRPGFVSCRDLEQRVDELNLSSNIRTAHPPRLPFRIMCMASYPWIVRRAAWNSRKTCMAVTRRLIAR